MPVQGANGLPRRALSRKRSTFSGAASLLPLLGGGLRGPAVRGDDSPRRALVAVHALARLALRAGRPRLGVAAQRAGRGACEEETRLGQREMRANANLLTRLFGWFQAEAGPHLRHLGLSRGGGAAGRRSSPCRALRVRLYSSERISSASRDLHRRKGRCWRAPQALQRAPPLLCLRQKGVWVVSEEKVTRVSASARSQGAPEMRRTEA